MELDNIATQAFYETINSPIIKILVGYAIATILAFPTSIAYIYCFKINKIETDEIQSSIDKYEKIFLYFWFAILFIMYQIFWS